MPSEYQGTRDVKKIHYRMGILLTQQKKAEILKETFRRRMGFELNLEDPRSFNEKIMWSKLYYQNPLITRCCDKYAVKDYVRETVGEGYTVPTLGVWERPEDIDFDALPDRFVLKVNWASGYNIIVPDKSQLDVEDARRKLRRWLKPDRNSYYQFFNWGYKHMKPVIYAEEYLEQENGQVYDYKFFTFGGEAKVLLVCTDRNTDDPLNFDYFDLEYRPLPITCGGAHHSQTPPPRPKNLERMRELAQKLAAPFPFCRVDFYAVGDRVYLGEMTFYAGGGLLLYDPLEWEYQFGQWYVLPEKWITDKEGPLLPMAIALEKGKRKVLRGLRRLRRCLIRHDVYSGAHYVTLFQFLRIPVTLDTRGGWRYATATGVQMRYKRAQEQPSDTGLQPPAFAPLPPQQAFLMEDRITHDMKKHYIEQKAYAQLHYFPNLDHPRSFNEKLLWLALNYKNPIHAVASDKARAKAWIAQRVGEEYVLPLLGVYDNPNDIDFEALPEKFVMKSNAGWGADQVVLVTKKSRKDYDRLRALASSWLYPWCSYYYFNMCITDEKPEKPLVVIEEFLDGGKQYLDDYKFYCCNGQMQFALIVTDRGSPDQCRTFVDRDWKVLPVRRAGKFSSGTPEKPKNLEKMLELAKILSKDVPMVRIDFYNVDGRIYVGEMTFTPGLFLRFQPREWDYRLGELLDIRGLMGGEN